MKHIQKTPTGIKGFDELLMGGLPSGRPALLCGAAGCGKTLLAMTFLVNGVSMFRESGVFMSFEERESDLVENVASLGYDVGGMVDSGKLVIDFVRIERSEIEESGEYDLEGLFVRLGHAIDRVGAKRVVLDTIEALFAGLADTPILRSELRRLFAWLKDRGVTAVITAERGDGQLTRHGIEEYVSDCVVLLDNRVEDQITTRRMRVVKYRGSAHGTNEYPFLIDAEGISVLPITSAGLGHVVYAEAVATGVPGLDAMLGMGGYFRGSSVLISGLAGTGKSTFAAAFVDAGCSRGHRCLIFAFEESPDQFMRNMRSVGIDLRRHHEAGLLSFEAARPSLHGFEMHLARMNRDIERFEPDFVVVDPISALRGPNSEVHSTLVRLTDICKTRGVTALFTSLSEAGETMDETERSISSLMDTWISLRDMEANGERSRVLYVLKSRGMDHSKQLREYRLTSRGIELIDTYVGPNGVLTGSARVAQEARERDAALGRRQTMESRQRELERKREDTERRIEDLRWRLASEETEIATLIAEDEARELAMREDRRAMTVTRGTHK